jgi:invasion protein IalB
MIRPATDRRGTRPASALHNRTAGWDNAAVATIFLRHSMRMKMAVPALTLVGVLLMILTGSAAAQQTAPRPAPRPAAPRPVPEPPPAAALEDTPQSTTATYGDWVLQCVTRAGPPRETVCDVAQITQLQGKNIPFSRVAVAHPQKGQLVKLIVQVPVNASFASDVRLQPADNEAALQAPFLNCTPNGCFAEFDLKDETMRKLRTASGAGKLSFADAGGHDITVPVSFNGFGQAFDALVKK